MIEFIAYNFFIYLGIGPLLYLLLWIYWMWRSSVYFKVTKEILNGMAAARDDSSKNKEFWELAAKFDKVEELYKNNVESQWKYHFSLYAFVPFSYFFLRKHYTKKDYENAAN